MTSNTWRKYLFILWKPYTLLKQRYLAITASQNTILQSFTRPDYIWAAYTWTWNRLIFRTSPVCISEVPASSFLVICLTSFTDCTQFYYSFFHFSLFDLKHIIILPPHSTLLESWAPKFRFHRLHVMFRYAEYSVHARRRHSFSSCHHTGTH